MKDEESDQMAKKVMRKLIMPIVSGIIQTTLAIILSHITTVPITIIVSVLSIGILTFINYWVNNFYDIPVYVRKLKKLIYSNKNYDRITNMDKILDFFKKDEVNSFFKLIFPIITRDVNPNSPIHYLELKNKRFYEFLIYNNKLSVVKLDDKEFISAMEYNNRRNVIVGKKCLKFFFKDLINKNKNPGTDYMDYIAEKKKDDSYQDIANMIGNISFM